MGLDGVAPLQSGLIVPPQPEPDPPEGDPEEEGGGKANGVVGKLQSGHFKGKGVSDLRLRIAHFDNPDLEPVDPAELSPVPEEGASKAYEKFLAQYAALYAASLPPETEELTAPEAAPTAPEVPTAPDEPVAETPPEPVEPVETPSEPVEPVAETPPDPEGPVAETPPEPVSVIVTPLEIELIPASGQTEPEEPVDEGDGALAAFDELLDAQASEEEPEALDVVM